MARIAIDARKIGDFGIGSYLESLLTDLARLPVTDEFVVFLPRRARLPVPAPHLRAVETPVGHYGLAEHLVLPWLSGRERATLYHAPHYVLPWLLRQPAIVTIHDLIHLRFPEHLPGRGAHTYARAVMGRSFRRAERVLTVSESSKRDLLEYFGGDPARVTVIPNRIDEAFFAARDAAELRRTRERWKLPERFVLYSGNIKPHKNLDRLLRAFAALQADPALADVRLVLIGNDLARYHSLRRLAAELGIAERLRPLGYLPKDELSTLYRLASAFAYPSLYEGFGLPPLEAMAAGVPVVAGNRSSLPEVLGDAALLVDPEDVEAIAGALARVLGDAALAGLLRRRGELRAGLYRGDEPTRRLLAVYHEVARS